MPLRAPPEDVNPLLSSTDNSNTNSDKKTNGYTISPVSDDNTNDSLLGVCKSLADRINNFLEIESETLDSELLRAVQRQTRIALGVIEEALQRYSLEEISLSYNGGKDCLVLLILLLCVLSKHTPSSHTTTSSSPSSPLPTLLPAVYIISPHPFPEVDHFVSLSSKTYHLALSRYTLPMKQAFSLYLQEHTKVKAILVGTRRTDPHGADLTHFDRTDMGWPGFMRVHPVIDWHYAEIWSFIRYFQIPYCELYDQGYTSLGGTTDTHPNPVLKAAGGGEEQTTKEQKFRPAYELVEDDAERLGRDWK